MSSTLAFDSSHLTLSLHHQFAICSKNLQAPHWRPCSQSHAGPCVIDWPFSVQLPNSFPVPIRPARQLGACGFLSIPVSWLACVTQHRINSPFLVSHSQSSPSLGNRGLGLHENAKHRFSPPQSSCGRDLSNILCIYNERLNHPCPALCSLWRCCMHSIALLVTHLLSCSVMDVDSTKRW